MVRRKVRNGCRVLGRYREFLEPTFLYAGQQIFRVGVQFANGYFDA